MARQAESTIRRLLSHKSTSRLFATSVLLIASISALALSTIQLSTSSMQVQACNNCNFELAWGTSGSGPGQFSGPIGIAVDSLGNVYVVDSTLCYYCNTNPPSTTVPNNNRVEQFDSFGNFRSAWGCTNAANAACPFPPPLSP